MKCVAPFLLALALLVRVAAPAAAETTCQTPNGPRTQSQLSVELAAAGYAGPWDLASMAVGYGRAVAGLVTCGGQPAAATLGGHRTIIVEIGGYDSTIWSRNWAG